MAYSNDGAYLAVVDERKVTTAFNVADGYSVNHLLSYISFFVDYSVSSVYMNRYCLLYHFSFFILFLFTRSKMSFTDTTPNQCPWPGLLTMSTLQLVGWT